MPTPAAGKPLSLSRVLFAACVTIPLIGMGIDLIAPSLPAISHSLNMPPAFAKNLISIYLFSYALSSFLSGFLSDAWGRKGLIITGLLIFIVGSLLPAISPGVHSLVVGRFLQGIGIGTYNVTNRAVLSDVLSKEALMRIAPLGAALWGIGPIIGPFIGGYLQFYFGWQAGFYFYASYALIGLLFVIFLMPETHHHRQALNLTQIGHSLKEILTHRVFIGSILLMGASYSLLIVFNALGPFLIQSELGFSPVFFGRVALWMGIVFLLGTLLCRGLLKKYALETILYVVIPLYLIIALITLGFVYVKGTHLWEVVIPGLYMFFGCGLVYPLGVAKGMALFRHLAGSASAVMNFITLLITTTTAMLTSFINVTTMVPVALMYVVLILICGLCYWFLIRQKVSAS